MGNIVTIFTDGSATNSVNDFGGAAAVIRYKNQYKEIVSGSWSSTTNNRMELLGIILGLNGVKKGYQIVLTTDSQVCLKWIDQLRFDYPTQSEIKNMKNGDLLLRLNKLLDKHKGNLTFKWVRGHIGVEDNERCDVLAGEVALLDNPTRDIGSGIGECPSMLWFYHDSGSAFIDFDTSIEYNSSQGCDTLGKARKMSTKEVTQLLRDRGWKPKDIKELKIDKSNYKKPI
jgi:ribonuclease HI